MVIMGSDGGFVMMPVRERYYGQVARLLAGLEEEADEDGGEPTLSPWGQDEMTAMYRDASDDIRVVLDYLAAEERAGEEVRVSEIAEALNKSPSDVSGIIGPLNKTAKNTYGRVPPMQSKAKGVRAKDGRRLIRRYLSMPEDVAEMVRAAAQSPRRRASRRPE